MKVSILVPVYGVEKYIGQCAETLFSQTYDDIEYVFVDDCTPDDSIQVLRQVLSAYPQRTNQVNIIRHDHNRGLGAARKTAFEASTGEFVMNVDSDDYLATDAVEKLVACQQQTGADIVDSAFQRLLPDGSLGAITHPFQGSPENMLRLLLSQNTVSHNVWGRLIRRSLHTDNGIDFIDGINMAEDYCLMTRLMFVATSFAYINDVIYYYRVNESGTFMSWLTEKHMSSYLDANRVVGEFLAAHDTDGRFTFPYEMGMLNTLYHSLAIFKRRQIEAVCPYRPKHWLFRCCYWLLYSQTTRALLRMVYLVIKNLYVRKYRKLIKHG